MYIIDAKLIPGPGHGIHRDDALPYRTVPMAVRCNHPWHAKLDAIQALRRHGSDRPGTRDVLGVIFPPRCARLIHGMVRFVYKYWHRLMLPHLRSVYGAVTTSGFRR